MKYLITTIALLPFFAPLFSQGLTKNAKGESSVIMKGTSIALDIAETELSFGMNNLQKSIGSDGQFIFGGNIKAKNESGIGDFVTKGDFVPEANIGGFLGYSYSNGIPKNQVARYNLELIKYRQALEELDMENLEYFKASINSAFSDLDMRPLRDSILLVFDEASKAGYRVFVTGLETLLTKYSKEKKKKEYLERLLIDVRKQNDKSEKIGAQAEKGISKLDSLISSGVYVHLMVFGFGELNASKFKRFINLDPTNLSNSFKEESFLGGKFGVGSNFQCGNVTIGLTYGRIHTNNFDALTKKEYTLRTTDVNNNQSLIAEKKITAYNGDYGNVTVNEVGIDLITRFPLDKNAKNHLLVNPYFNAQFCSSNEMLLPNTQNIGCGFYFFRSTGAFLGGLYIELPDIQQNIENNKPIEDQNLKDASSRLTFGIVGKFAIGSMLNTF